MKRKVQIRVKSNEAGMSVIDLLAGRFSYQTRIQWLHVIGSGQILLNRHAAQPAARLNAGDTLAYLAPDLSEPPVDTQFAIIYEDQLLLVVDKPANLPCHPAGRYFNHTLWALLKECFSISNPVFVNRIDRETSGIVLVAKSMQAAQHCQRQLREKVAFKRYVALVEGRFPSGTIIADGYLTADPQSCIRKKLRFHATPNVTYIPPDGKACRTVFNRIKCQNGISQVEAIPETGRLHQIRASLCSLGYPLIGDKMYGVDDSFFIKFIDDRLTSRDRSLLRLPRQALHAAELHIIHPETGIKLEFTAPVPQDMQRLLD